MGLGCSGNRAKCVSLPPCSLKDAFLLPNSREPGPHAAQREGPGGPAAVLGTRHIPSAFTEVCPRCSGWPHAGAELRGQRAGLGLLQSRALGGSPGPCPSAPAATTGRLLHAGPHAGCRGRPPSCPHQSPPAPLLFVGWVVDWSPRLLVRSVGRDPQRRGETAR